MPLFRQLSVVYKSISIHSGCFNIYTYHHLIVAHFSEFF